MSINKNFVVKNGFEVNADLILANASTRKVGIGTSNPRYNLEVRGGIGATDVIVSGIATVLNELRVGTAGTIFTVIAGPTGVAQSVGVGTANPGYLLDVRSPVSAGQTALYVQGDVKVTGNINLDGDINIDEISTRNLNVTGVSTFVGFSTFNDYVFIQDGLNVVGAGATLATLNVTGVSTFAGITTVTGETLFSKQLNVSGITTLGVTTATNLTTQNINNSGVTTLGVTTVTNLTAQQLNVSGISTFAGVTTHTAALFGTQAYFSGVVTASSFVGSGASLTGNARNLTATIGIGTSVGVVGYGVSFLDLRGPGLSTVYYNSSVGIATIYLQGGGGGATIGIGTTPGEAFVGIVTAGNLWYNSNLGRLFIYYVDPDGAQWVDAAPFNVGIITGATSFSLAAGSASSPSLYFAGDQQTGFFSPGAGQFTVVSVGSSILNINPSGINITGILTASSFSGNASSATYATTAGISTVSQGLTGTPNIVVGVATITTLNATNSNSTNLNVSGITTLGVTTATNLTSQQLNVSGVSTFAGIATYTSSIFGTQASFSGVVTATSAIVGSAITMNNSGLTIAGISTFNGNLIFNQFANEKVNIVAGTANGNTNIDLITNGSVHYFTSNSTATWTPNFRASSTATLDSVMSVGQVVTATIISTQNNTSYYASAVNVDGTSRTVYWSGGSAPTAGSSSGVDMYTYSIVKTASNTFTVFASISQYA